MSDKRFRYLIIQPLFYPFSFVLLAAFIAQLVLVAPAKAADCVYGGKTYSPGDTRGPYVCMPDGTWQQK